MRIQPRQQLLEIWQSTSRASFRDGKWVWGGRHEGSSISDAEQLLCLMLPATEIPRFRLDRPDETHEDILRALKVFGDEVEIPRQLVRTLTDYMRNYADADGVPSFTGGAYVTPRDPASDVLGTYAQLDVVESFATSITLSLAAIGFCRVFLTSLSRPELISDVTELEQLANRRLTAALVGLLRSFTINVFEVDSDYGSNLLRTVNQERLPQKAVIEGLNLELRGIRAGLRDYVSAGSGQNVDLDPSRLFECGWSWGVIEDAPKVPFVDGVLQREGHAIDAPYLYFTVVALDGIADLFSPRTRLLGLLNEDQQRLARALQIRWELTQSYWATVASYGAARWPLEDIPWRTVDGVESDYFTLLVTAIAARDLAQQRDTEVDLNRLGEVLAELANRGRLTRRPFAGDPAVALHEPGVAIELEFAEDVAGPELVYQASDFAPLLLKRVLRVAGLTNDIELRGSLLELADQIWDHVVQRKMREGIGRDLWDQPAIVYDSLEVRHERPTWHHTLRVVESLVFAAELAATHPLRSEGLAGLAQELLAEAEHLFDQEQLAGSTEGGPSMRQNLETVRRRLHRARQITADRPGSAVALLLNVLGEVDQLAAARSDLAGRGLTMLVFATSDKGGTGRSVTSSNLVYRRAVQGSDVCYLDFDFGSPTAGSIFQIDSIERGCRHGGLHSYLRGDVNEAMRVDVWTQSDRASLRGRPDGAGQLVLYPGDMGGGEFAASPQAVRRCVELLLKLDEEFDIILVDLSAGRSFATQIVLEATADPRLRNKQTRWLVFHRWTRQHIIAAAGLVHGEEGLIRVGVALGHDEAKLTSAIRLVRTAVVDPKSQELIGLRPAQIAWLHECNQQLQRLASDLRVGRTSTLGVIPLDPLLQWREQLISDTDTIIRQIANQATVEAFAEIAKKLTEDSAWDSI